MNSPTRHLRNGHPLTISEMQDIAIARGGTCLSEIYVNTYTPLKWRCSKNHIWLAQPGSIKRGTWCPHCASYGNPKFPKLSIVEMRAIAKTHGGKCLSPTYTNSFTHLEWRCLNGHIWRCIPSNIKRGYWCPHCSNHAKLTITDMHKDVKKFGGKCLSKIYTNANTPLKWQCLKGHIWMAKPNHVRHGHWCPHCVVYKGEQNTRAIFEQIFRSKFPKTRPVWLCNGTHRLELDGYSKRLGIAFEYQGEQHYKHSRIFHKRQSLVETRLHDKIKLVLCKKHNVRLFQIPYTIPKEKLGVYILNKYLRCMGVFS